MMTPEQLKHVLDLKRENLRTLREVISKLQEQEHKYENEIDILRELWIQSQNDE